MKKIDPIAFMSYVHLDDQHENGRLTALRERISGEVRIQTGDEFPIFQDRKDIKWGENWRKRVDDSVDGCTFLIPIITPGFFKSKECMNELRRFLKRERDQGRDDLILPIYYVGCPAIEDKEKRSKDRLAEAIVAHQYADLRGLRFEPLTGAVAGKAIEKLALDIRDALERTAELDKASPKPAAKGPSSSSTRRSPSMPPSKSSPTDRIQSVMQDGAVRRSGNAGSKSPLVSSAEKPGVSTEKATPQVRAAKDPAASTAGDSALVTSDELARVVARFEAKLNRLVGRMDSPPVLTEEKRIQKLDPRIDAAARQAVNLGRAGAQLEIAVVRSLIYRLYKSGDLAQALVLQQYVIGNAVAEAGDYSNLGLFLSGTGSREEAEGAYRRAIALDPRCITAWTNLGSLLYREKRTEEAETAFRRAIALDPKHAGPWTGLGVVLASLERNNEAEQAHRRAIELSPAYALAWSNLGIILKRQGHVAEAEQAYRKAIALDPQNAQAFSYLGTLLAENGRQEEGEKALTKAVELDPRDAEAWGDLGTFLAETGRQEEGENALRKAVELDARSAMAWGNLGIFLVENGKQEEGEKALREATDLDAKNARAWRNLGMFLIDTGRRGEGEKVCRKAIDLGSKNPDDLNSFAYFLWQRGELEAAEAQARKAVGIDPNHSYSHATLGLLRFERNDLGAGVKEYERAIELSPDDMPLHQKFHYEYGRALARNGRKDEARKELHTALDTPADYVPRSNIEAELSKLG